MAFAVYNSFEERGIRSVLSVQATRKILGELLADSKTERSVSVANPQHNYLDWMEIIVNVHAPPPH